MNIRTAPLTGEQVARRAMFLAYQASGTAGLGVLHLRDGVTEDQVWAATNGEGEAYGDYVSGRMVKLGLSYKPDSVTVDDGEPNVEYQSWCRSYKSYECTLVAPVTSVAMPPME